MIANARVYTQCCDEENLGGRADIQFGAPGYPEAVEVWRMAVGRPHL